jgi:hypothetical protein
MAMLNNQMVSLYLLVKSLQTPWTAEIATAPFPFHAAIVAQGPTTKSAAEYRNSNIQQHGKWNQNGKMQELRHNNSIIGNIIIIQWYNNILLMV